MTEKNNLEVVKSGMEAFRHGDVEGLIATLDEGVELASSGPPGAVPWAGTYRGKKDAQRFFAAYDAIEYDSFEPIEYIAAGENVVVRGRERWRAKQTGATCDNEWVVLFTLGNGKITRMRVYEDTAAVAQATGGLQVATSAPAGRR